MTPIIVKTITAKEAADRLRAAGMKMTRERVCAGIEQGVYPWGDYVKLDAPIYTIYEKLFMKWLKERGDEIPEGAGK